LFVFWHRFHNIAEPNEGSWAHCESLKEEQESSEFEGVAEEKQEGRQLLKQDSEYYEWFPPIGVGESGEDQRRQNERDEENRSHNPDLALGSAIQVQLLSPVTQRRI